MPIALAAMLAACGSKSDPCSTGNGGCDKNAVCMNAGAVAQCLCNTGYSGDGKSCTAVDNCATNNGGCDKNATCTKIGPGESGCECNTGYSGDGKTCTAVDPCASQHGGCDPNAACTSTGPGTNTCACKPGYTGDGMSCTAIDNCTTNNGGCGANATCTSTGPGTNTCACAEGYVSMAAADGGSPDAGPEGGLGCMPIDACATNNGGCDPNAACTSTGPGTHTCACNTGYSGDGMNCAPVNSCNTNSGGCDPNALCTSTGPGTNTCACNTGYSGDGMSCAPVNSCNTNNGGCAATATCDSTGPGTNTCTCPNGLVAVGSLCLRPGMMLINDGATTTSSANVSLTLQPPGNLLQNFDLATGDLTDWTPSGDVGKVQGSGYFSGDAFVTSYHPDIRSQTVDLLAAGYTAAQLDGPNRPPFIFMDWMQGQAVGDGLELVSVQGFLLDANQHPIAEQDLGSPGNGIPIDPGFWAPIPVLIPSYPPGARYLMLVDSGQNEVFPPSVPQPLQGPMISDSYAGVLAYQVTISNDGQTWSTPQSWTPFTPWTLTGSGQATVLVRFLDLSGNVVQEVSASIGYCPPGFTMSGATCLDTQECEDGTAHCDANATCTDQVGAYTCTCKVGYSGSGATCSPISSCQENACDPHATCSSAAQGSSPYTCTCNGGYTGNGLNGAQLMCYPENACTISPGPCPANATCTDTGPGTFSCACNSGYTLISGQCILTNPCALPNYCAHGTCTPPNGGPSIPRPCQCDSGYMQTSPGTCTEVNPCTLEVGICANGTCNLTGPGTSTCTCPAGYAQVGNACLPNGELVLALGATTASSATVNLNVLPAGNLLTNSNFSSGSLSGWSVTGSVSVQGSGFFSGHTADAAGRASLSQTVNAVTSGLQASGLSLTSPQPVAQVCYSGGEVQVNSYSPPIRPGWACFGLILPAGDSTFGVQAIPPTGGSMEIADTYLGPYVQWELSNDGTTWSKLYDTQTSPYMWTLSGTGASSTVYARFTFDKGTTFLPTVSSTICNIGYTLQSGTCQPIGSPIPPPPPAP